MDAIERAAFVSIGRACGFAGLATIVVLLSLSFDPALATRVAGVLAMTIAGIVFLYGLTAPKRPYRRTEAWLILKKEYRPPQAVAQKLIGNALKETSFWFARKSAGCAAILLTASIGFKLV